jgi:hypothetical protein
MHGDESGALQLLGLLQDPGAQLHRRRTSCSNAGDRMTHGSIQRITEAVIVEAHMDTASPPAWSFVNRERRILLIDKP